MLAPFSSFSGKTRMYLNSTAARIIITGPGMPTTFSSRPPRMKKAQMTSTPAPMIRKSTIEPVSSLTWNLSFSALTRISEPSPLRCGRLSARRAR
ncbi:hypothetical protein D3C87_1663940 [compost metagenome]